MTRIKEKMVFKDFLFMQCTFKSNLITVYSTLFALTFQELPDMV